MLDLSKNHKLMSQISHFELFVTKIIICYKNLIFNLGSKWRQKSPPMAPEHHHAGRGTLSSRAIHVMRPLDIGYGFPLSHPNYLLQETQFLILDRIEDQTVYQYIF